jgi:methyltransferase (TIGR00027 family)
VLAKLCYFVDMSLKVGTVKAINTGMGVAFLKATGMLFPKEKRLFEDPFAQKLLPPFHRFIIFLMRRPKIFNFLMRFREKTTPGLVGWMFCRFRYIDDVLKDSLKKVETVVNLGSGMDCRAYYIPGAENIRYFEVDHPSVIKKKKAKMKKILGTLPNHVVYVPVDFEKQSLDTQLKKAGYNLTSKTLFIWEGVTQYISEQANDNTLGFMAQAAAGSKIVFTYVPKSFIEGKNINDDTKNMYKWMVKRFSLWVYGLDPEGIGEYLSKYSLHLIEDIGSEQMQEHYMKPTNLGLTIFDIERIALAEVKDQNIS